MARLGFPICAALLLAPWGMSGCDGAARVNRLYASEFADGTIIAYQLPLGVGSQQIAISFNPGKTYTAIATDSAGALYATNSSSAQVGRPTLDVFVPLQNGSTPYLYEKTFAHPLDVAIDRLNRVFVAEQCFGDPPPCQDEIEVWVPPLSFNQHSTFVIPTYKPVALAFDPQNNLFVAHQVRPFITEYLGSVTVASTPVMRTDAGLSDFPATIRIDGSGALYAVQGSGLGVAVFVPPLTAAMTAATTLDIPSNYATTGVAVDQDGTAYAGYTNTTSSRIVGYLPTSRLQNVAVTTPISIVLSMAIGPGPAGTPVPYTTPTP